MQHIAKRHASHTIMQGIAALIFTSVIIFSVSFQTKLINKETAVIPCISAERVKKTRTGLQKRLELDEGIDLDKQVYVFRWKRKFEFLRFHK